MTRPFRVAAIVPAFDAAPFVGDVVRDLARFWTEADSILVVDDGSRDGTAAAAARAGATVVTHPRNRGKGAALRTGLSAAAERGFEVAVSVDADGQHPAEEAHRLLDASDVATDLVLGTRDLARDGAPRANRFSNGFSNFFLSIFSGQRLLDTQCGLRRYPIEATLALGGIDDGYAFEAEVILRAVAAGWRIVQCPVRVIYPPPSERLTHFDAVRDPARILRRVLTTVAATRMAPRPPRVERKLDPSCPIVERELDPSRPWPRR